MNDIPLVATDLDGTLLDYRTRSVPAGFGAMLDRVLAAGAAFAVASGRTPDSVRSLFPAYADRIWIASDNGARLSRGADVVFERALEPALWRELSAASSRRLDPGTPPRAAEATKPPRRGTRRGRLQTSGAFW